MTIVLNIFQRFIKSLYSPKDIAKYRFLGIGKRFCTFFTYVFIHFTWIISFFKMTITALNEGKQIFMEELPPFQIENGNLTSNIKEPFTLQSPIFKSYSIQLEKSPSKILKKKVMLSHY